jgi:hypothetical protein
VSAPEYFSVVIAGEKSDRIFFVRNHQVFLTHQCKGLPTWKLIEDLVLQSGLNQSEIARILLLVDGVPAFLIPVGEPMPPKELLPTNFRQTLIATSNMQLVHPDSVFSASLVKEFPWLRLVHVGEALLNQANKEIPLIVYVTGHHAIITYQRNGVPVFMNSFKTADVTEALYFLTAVMQQHQLDTQTEITVVGDEPTVKATVAQFQDFYAKVNEGFTSSDAWHLLITWAAKCA